MGLGVNYTLKELYLETLPIHKSLFSGRHINFYDNFFNAKHQALLLKVIVFLEGTYKRMIADNYHTIENEKKLSIDLHSYAVFSFKPSGNIPIQLALSLSNDNWNTRDDSSGRKLKNYLLITDERIYFKETVQNYSDYHLFCRGEYYEIYAEREVSSTLIRRIMYLIKMMNMEYEDEYTKAERTAMWNIYKYRKQEPYMNYFIKEKRTVSRVELKKHITVSSLPATIAIISLLTSFISILLDVFIPVNSYMAFGVFFVLSSIYSIYKVKEIKLNSSPFIHLLNKQYQVEFDKEHKVEWPKEEKVNEQAKENQNAHLEEVLRSIDLSFLRSETRKSFEENCKELLKLITIDPTVKEEIQPFENMYLPAIRETISKLQHLKQSNQVVLTEKMEDELNETITALNVWLEELISRVYTNEYHKGVNQLNHIKRQVSPKKLSLEKEEGH